MTPGKKDILFGLNGNSNIGNSNIRGAQKLKQKPLNSLARYGSKGTFARFWAPSGGTRENVFPESSTWKVAVNTERQRQVIIPPCWSR